MAKVEQYDAIDFFDFCEVSSDEVTEAGFQWRSLILPLVLQEDPAQLKRLVVSWYESKCTRQKYWEENFGVMDTATGITALRESLTAFEQEKSCVWRRLIPTSGTLIGCEFLICRRIRTQHRKQEAFCFANMDGDRLLGHGEGEWDQGQEIYFCYLQFRSRTVESTSEIGS